MVGVMKEPILVHDNTTQRWPLKRPGIVRTFEPEQQILRNYFENLKDRQLKDLSYPARLS
jgi:hypothetical protein